MRYITLCILLLGLSIHLTAIAAEQIAKEDTTPPAAEGALTAPQIPPISSSNASNKSTTPQQTTQPPSNTPATVTSPTTSPPAEPTADELD
ncbi:MAG: hypothetical protein ACD_45C00473G0024 [uncultured bacterium]|nr:MAG: hypothetical protein ACD_45C00473G0024 [uncultured bacterium]